MISVGFSFLVNERSPLEFATDYLFIKAWVCRFEVGGYVSKYDYRLPDQKWWNGIRLYFRFGSLIWRKEFIQVVTQEV